MHDPAAPAPLAGLVVLLVEDEPLIALDVVCTLEDAGAVVEGAHATAAAAFAAMDGAVRLDAAVLDVDLGAETSEGIFHRLRRAGVPVVLHTGGSRPGTAARLEAPTVRKPALPATLVAAVVRAARGGRAARPAT